MIDTATLSDKKLYMIGWICKLYIISWICKLYMISWICKLYMISWICKLYMISWICKLYDCSLLRIYRRTDASMTSLTINNILLFYHMKPIKSMLPCGSSVIYRRWRQNVIKTSPLFFFLTTFGRYLWSITAKTQCNMKSTTRVLILTWTILLSPLYQKQKPIKIQVWLTNKFQVAVLLSNNRWLMTSTRSKNKKNGTQGAAQCDTHVLLHRDIICDLLLNRRTAT